MRYLKTVKSIKSKTGLVTTETRGKRKLGITKSIGIKFKLSKMTKLWDLLYNIVPRVNNNLLYI